MVQANMIGISIKSLFGSLCSQKIFRHDQEMLSLKYQDDDLSSQRTSTSDESDSPDISAISPFGAAFKEGVGKNRDSVLKRDQTISNAMHMPYLETSSDILAVFKDKDSIPSSQDNSRLDFGTLSTNNLTLANKEFEELLDGSNVAPSPQSQVERRRATWDVLVERPTKRQKTTESASSEAGELEEYFSSLDRDRAEQSELRNFVVISHWDASDKIYRCDSCDWETVTPYGGCYGCGKGNDVYMESYNPFSVNRDAQPIICDADDVESEFGVVIYEELKDNFMEGSSAYESTDDEKSKAYEQNSFIDDASIKSLDDDSESDTDRKSVKAAEINWEAKYTTLLKQYDQLNQDFEGYQSFMERLNYGSDASLSEEEAENEMEGHVEPIDVEVPRLEAVDIILSDAQANSQNTDVSTGAFERRIEGYAAASSSLTESPHGRGWYAIGLMSAGDNHTTADIEL
jgi:hypothetical protein